MVVSGGTTGGGAGGMGAAGGMGGAGGGFPMCSAEPGPAMCGTNACATVAPGLLCIKTCCTTDTNVCGTLNNISPTCAATMENTSLCPNESVLGQMVSGCCVPGGNDCGIVNILMGNTCIRRQDVPIMPLAAKHCDGTPVMMTGGAGGAGGAGGGMGGEGGMGGAGGGDPADAGM